MVIFETERLILRKWTVNDADDFYEIEGTIRMFEIKNNKIIDKLIYSLSKSEYSEIYT